MEQKKRIKIAQEWLFFNPTQGVRNRTNSKRKKISQHTRTTPEWERPTVVRFFDNRERCRVNFWFPLKAGSPRLTGRLRKPHTGRTNWNLPRNWWSSVEPNWKSVHKVIYLKKHKVLTCWLWWASISCLWQCHHFQSTLDTDSCQRKRMACWSTEESALVWLPQDHFPVHSWTKQLSYLLLPWISVQSYLISEHWSLPFDELRPGTVGCLVHSRFGRGRRDRTCWLCVYCKQGIQQSWILMYLNWMEERIS